MLLRQKKIYFYTSCGKFCHHSAWHAIGVYLVNILLLLICLGSRSVILLAGRICKFYAGKNRRINIGYWHTFRIKRREFDLFVYKSEEPLKILKVVVFLIEVQILPNFLKSIFWSHFLSFKLRTYCSECFLNGCIFPSMNLEHGLLASFLMGKIFWNC
jgi:hypothetical protein